MLLLVLVVSDKIKLYSDIDMVSIANSTMIGSSGNHFEGTFDGNNKTITNLTVNYPAANAIGMFSYVGTNGKIDNVKIASSTITGIDAVGTIAGYHYGRIKGCDITTAVNGTRYVGGLVGRSYGDIEDCDITPTITASQQVGGIIGRFDATADNTVKNVNVAGSINASHYIGGIAGYFSNGTGITLTLDNVNVTTNITSNSTTTSSYAAGFLGYLNRGTLAATKIKYNGTLTADRQYAGGLFAYVNTAVPVNVNDCDVSGDLSITTINQRFLGGLAGYVRSVGNVFDTCSISATLNGEDYVSGGIANMLTTATVTMQNTSFTGTLNTSAGSDYIGGLFGVGHNTTLNNLISTTDINCNSYCGGVAAYLRGASSMNNITVNANITGLSFLAGAVAHFYLYNTGTVNNVNISGSITGNSYLGGLSGYIRNTVTTANNITSSLEIIGGQYLGGLVGRINSGSTIDFNNSDATGDITSINNYVGRYCR